MAKDAWDIAVDVAQILSALGTCGAVVVSLWLSLRTPEPKLCISAITKIRKSLYPQEILQIEVVNVGFVPAIIKDIGWVLLRKHFGLEKTRCFAIYGLTGLWAKLDHGERREYELLLPPPDALTRMSSHADIRELFRYVKTHEDLKRIRVFASTSVGKTVLIRPPEEFLLALAHLIESRGADAR